VELTTPRRKKLLFTERHKGPRAWTDSLDKRPKLKKMDMRLELGMLEVCIGQVRSGQWQKKSQNIS
jgi:hypothetical protein